MTPQIDHLGKMSTVLRVSTHIFGVSKEIDEKTCTLNLQLLHNTKRPTKWSGHAKMIDPPRELLHMYVIYPTPHKTDEPINSNCGESSSICIYMKLTTNKHTLENKISKSEKPCTNNFRNINR